MDAGTNGFLCRAGPEMDRLGRLLTLCCAVAAIACDGATEPRNTSKLTLSVASVAIEPGTQQKVTVAVTAPAGGVQLKVTGLPSGIGATFSREFLDAGETLSELTVAADPAAPPGQSTITISAAAAQNPAGAAQATLKVYVVASPCPGYAIPSSCPPFPTGGSGLITGILRERFAGGTRPIAGPVWAWVQYPDHGYSAGRVSANANGEYRFPNLPAAFIVMQAGGGSYDQPCATTLQFDGANATADIEIVSETAPVYDPNPPPPALTGVVYENTEGGRVPVAGARVFVEVLSEIVAATTTTDEEGRYSLCRIPQYTPWVTPVKSGYATTGHAVSISGVTQLDIEMKRQ